MDSRCGLNETNFGICKSVSMLKIPGIWSGSTETVLPIWLKYYVY